MKRRTKPQARLAEVILNDPDSRHWGYELSKAAHVRSGVLYPMLTRWWEAGWLQDGWEAREEAGHRPPRRYYQLTPAGRASLPTFLELTP